MTPPVLNTFSILFLAILIINQSVQNDEDTEDYDNLIEGDYFEKLIVKSVNEASSYKFPKDNSEYFKNLDDETLHDYGTFDFIVIGSGSTGSVVASRLASFRSWKILLLEAGELDDQFTNIPAMSQYTLSSKANWGYNTTSQKNGCKGFVNSQCIIPRGKILGGCSSINCLIYTRGNPEDYNNWEKAGNVGWSWKDVEPYFKKMENAQFASNLGRSGPLYINYTSPSVRLEEIFAEAFQSLGVLSTEYNGNEQVGTSRIQYNIKRGKRVSGANAYVKPALHRGALNATLNALVTKIHVDSVSNIATGVEFVRNGNRYIAKFENEIVLSAGAINSPQILMLSGIGPQDLLAKHNIPTIKDLPVGVQLLDQIVFNIVFNSNYTQNLVPLKTQVEDFLRGEGLLTLPCNGKSLAFIQNGNSTPKVEYVLLPPSGGADYLPNNSYSPYIQSINAEFMSKINPKSCFSILAILLHPKSTGTVQIQSNNPQDFPLIDSGIFTAKEDVEEMYKAIKYIVEVVSKSEPFQRINSSVFVPIPPCYAYEMYSREYWYCAIEFMALPTYHNMGTTPMGVNPKYSVVNHQLKVHGIEKLRVADCGIIPNGVSGHTSGPAFMIGEKLASMLKKEYRTKKNNSTE